MRFNVSELKFHRVEDQFTVPRQVIPGRATVAPYDATRTTRLASGSGGGLTGAVVVAAVDAAADNSKNDWRYPVAKVVMEVDPPAN